MNNILKTILGGTKLYTNKAEITPPVLIDIKPKSNNKIKAKPYVKKNIEDPITEKEIQAAMKRIKKIEAEARKRIVEEELKSQNVTFKAKSTKSEALKPKKKSIPSHVKTLIWNHWVGHDKAEAFCLCCKVTKISIRSFHAGHIIAESKGGDMTVKNLKPICGPCNHSMGSMNMDEFIKKFGLGK